MKKGKTIEIEIRAAGDISVEKYGGIYMHVNGTRVSVTEMLYNALPERVRNYSGFHGTLCISLVEDPEYFEMDGAIPADQAIAFASSGEED